MLDYVVKAMLYDAAKSEYKQYSTDEELESPV
jgi:hypothetical protein